jgi:microcystin-dependent protein
MGTPEANLESNSLPDAELNTASLQGSLFPKGDSGEIIIEATITTEPGTNAEVINSGTRSKAKLTFKIPRGNTGATGNGIASVTKVGTQGLVDTYRITMTDGTYYDFTVTNADVGSAYTKTETNQLLDAKVDKTSISDDYTTTKTDADKALVTSLWATKTLKATIDSTTGALANLTTTDKTNLVSAINELVTALSGKAAKATTLAGYGITDAYTKDEVYSKSDTYSKGEVDSVANGKVTNSYSSSPNTAYSANYINSLAYVPVGVVQEFAGSVAPTGYLMCDGSAVSRTTYAALFAVIGTTYGAGDGSTTFNVPNRKGRVGVGYDSTQTEFDTLGETGGEKTHVLTINELPSNSLKTASTGSNSDGFIGRNGYSSDGNYNFGGQGQAHNNLQPYIAMNYIIKY